MLLRLSKLFEKISFKLRQKSIYFELKHYIKKNKSYFKTIHTYDRGIGKTYSLIKLAHKYNCPIIVPNCNSKNFIKHLNRQFHKKDIEVIVALEHMRGKRLTLALCDEGIRFEIIKEVILPNCKRLIGYINEK